MKATREKDGEPTPEKLRPVLNRLCALFGLWSIEKHLATLYQGKSVFTCAATPAMV